MGMFDSNPMMADDREGRAKDALGDGCDAYRAGKSPDDNPHSLGTMEGQMWLKGWKIEQVFSSRREPWSAI